MKVTRLYTGDDGQSHFEDIDVPLFDQGDIGQLSELVPATGVIFRETSGEYHYEWHNAPRRQYIVMLEGEVEIEVGWRRSTAAVSHGRYFAVRGHHRAGAFQPRRQRTVPEIIVSDAGLGGLCHSTCWHDLLV